MHTHARRAQAEVSRLFLRRRLLRLTAFAVQLIKTLSEKNADAEIERRKTAEGELARWKEQRRHEYHS